MEETRFQKYINERIDKIVVSDPEKHILEAIDTFGIKGCVKLIYVDEDKFELYDAIVNSVVEPSRFSFNGKGKVVSHGLKGKLHWNDEVRERQLNSLFVAPKGSDVLLDPLFENDEKLRNLLESVKVEINNLGLKKKDQLIIVASRYTWNLLRYAFQQAVTKVFYLNFNKKKDPDLRKRIEISHKLGQMDIGIQDPMNSLWGLITNKNNIYVPLTEDTLDSMFYNAISWRDVLGNLADRSESADIQINNVPCRLIRVNPFVDAFGNVFITIFSILDKHWNNTIVKGPALTEQDSSILDEIILFDGSSIKWETVKEEIPNMQEAEVDETLNKINGVFETIYSCDRIVTDTNFWMTEYPKGSHLMSYRKLIEDIAGRLDPERGQGFDLVSKAYQELDNKAGIREAASIEGKELLGMYQQLNMATLVGVTLEQDPDPYADPAIGNHILSLLSANKKVAVLTNDRGALMRWRQAIMDANEANRKDYMPPMMLCRNLKILFELREDLIGRKKELEKIKNK